MKYLYLSTVLLVLIISSCDSSDGPTGGNGNADTSKIMPLKVGNSWTYQDEIYAEGVVIYVDTFTWTLSKESTINGETYYRVDTTDYYFLNRSTGLWDFYETTIEHIAKYPCNVGDTFGLDTIIGSRYDTLGNLAGRDTAIGTNKVTSLNSVVSANGELYTCVEYTQDYFLKGTTVLYAKDQNYYAPNIGKVKEHFEYFDKEQRKNQFEKVIRILLTKDLK